MKKAKYRFLVIAPFKGFRDFFLQEVQKRNDIESDIYSAKLHETSELIGTLDLSRYDAVICRGRSGKLIKELFSIPVINADFSSFDILRALQLAMFTTEEQIAFVSYFDLGDNVQFLCKLLDHRIKVIIPPAPSSPEKMEQLINTLYFENGIRLFVGDGGCVHYAKMINAESILVTSGPESMHKAVTDAIEICNIQRRLKKENNFFKTVMTKSSLPVAIFNSEKELVHSYFFTSDYAEGIHQELQSRIPKLQLHNRIKFIISSNKTSWKVSGELLEFEDVSYYIFQVAEGIPTVLAQNQYWQIVDSETVQSSLRLINSNPLYQDYWKKTLSVMTGKTPVIICGSPGSGRTTFAYALYGSSPWISNPLIEIDCYHINEKQCEKLFADERSPLFENNYTVLFKNMNALSAPLQNKFCYYFENLDLTQRNKVICTFTGTTNDLTDSGNFSQNLSYIISGFSLQLPSLNSRPELIIPIARSYLNELNQEFPVQLVGFEPDALKLLEEHHWEFGIAQFQATLKQLAIQSNSQLITTENVRSVLSELNAPGATRPGRCNINLNQSLEHITKDILLQVLHEENMNQTKAAKRLEISRSTLWKRLQE